MKVDGRWYSSIFLFNLVIFRCVPRIPEDHFLYNFAPHFLCCFCIRGLRKKGVEIWDPKLVEVPNLTLTYLKKGIERNREAWGDQNIHKELRPETWLKTHQKGAAQCNCLSFEYHIYIYIVQIYIYRHISYHVYIYTIWYVTYDGYHIEVSQLIIPMFLMQQPCRVSDAPLLFWWGHLPVYLEPFIFTEAASNFQFLWSPGKPSSPRLERTGKVGGNTDFNGYHRCGRFKVLSTLFWDPQYSINLQNDW